MLFTKKTDYKTTTIKQSRDYTRLKKIKIFNVLLFIIVISTLSTTFWFIYMNVYKTLGQIEDIALIKDIKKFETINFKIYEETISAWKEKNIAPKTLVPQRDPFNKILIISTFTSSTESNTSSSVSSLAKSIQ